MFNKYPTLLFLLWEDMKANVDEFFSVVKETI